MFRTILSALSIVLIFLSPLLAGQEMKEHPPKGKFGEAHKFVFFAVLEGCFDDGVRQQTIDLMIPIRPDRENRRSIVKNMVYSCPLCSAVFDGLRLYSDRQGFISGMSKTEWYNTFGQGLDEETRKALAEEGASCRKAIQGLVNIWIEKRISKSGMTPEEVKVIRKQLALMRDEGEKALRAMQKGKMGEELQKNYEGWKECPICQGVSSMNID